MNGYILESKSIIESDIWRKPPLYFKVWHYLLLKAEFKKSGSLDRGQLFTSIPEIAEACSYYVGYRKVTPTKKEIWSVLEFLRNPHESNDENDSTGTMIETTKVTHGMVVTICNYNKYQDPTSYERNSESHDENRMKESRNGREGNNIKNEIRIKNKDNKEIYKEKPIRNQIPPTVDMVKAYCIERGNNVDPQTFCDFYDSKDWYIGKNKMKDWQAAVRTWEKSERQPKDKTISDMREIVSGMTPEEYEEMERKFR